jgi:uncharacterized membrane protein
VSYSADGTKLMYGSEGADSAVQAADAPERPAAKSPSDKGGSEDAGDEGGTPSLKVGAVILAVGVAAFLGLRRLRRG